MDEPAEDQPVIFRGTALMIAARNRQEGELIGITNGCFDLFHEGHVEFLRGCASRCSFLLVGINGDESVKALKGPHRPIVPENQRLIVVQACRYVGQAFIFHERTCVENILELKPAIWFKGEDYTHDTLNPEEVAAAKACGAKIEIIETGVTTRTSDFIDRIAAASGPAMRPGGHGAGRG